MSRTISHSKTPNQNLQCHIKMRFPQKHENYWYLKLCTSIKLWIMELLVDVYLQSRKPLHSSSAGNKIKCLQQNTQSVNSTGVSIKVFFCDLMFHEQRRGTSVFSSSQNMSILFNCFNYTYHI